MLSSTMIRSLLILAVAVLEISCSDTLSTDEEDVATTEDLEDNEPLPKSIGFLMRNNFLRNSDVKLRQQHKNEYSDLLKASQEVTSLLEDNDDIATYLTRLKDMADRRRSVRMQSTAGRRRYRCQAMRKDKLNNQSLMSHRKHSSRSSMEQTLMIT